MPDLPIAHYALCSDCRGAALVSRSGSVDWLCLPRFDAPALFARLLDPAGGHWSITPQGHHDVERARSRMSTTSDCSPRLVNAAWAISRASTT